MNAHLRLALPLTLLLSFPALAAEADQRGLERQIWANPDFEGLRARVESLPTGGLRVEAVATEPEQAREAREWLGAEGRVESFQVSVNPRLRREPGAGRDAASLEAILSAVRQDAGTRGLVDMLGGATLDEQRVLRLAGVAALDAPTERRLVRLLRAQPGVAGVSIGSEPPAPPRAERAESAAPRDPAAGVTRLHLDPRQPEAADLSGQEPAKRTRLTLAEPSPERADAEAAEPPAAGAAASRPPDAEPAPEPVAEAAPAPAQDSVPEPVTEAPPESAAAGNEGPPQGFGGAAAQRAIPERSPVDEAVEELLGRAMELEGAPETVRARVTSGVVVFSGSVPAREMAMKLRELARNFDGVRRVTGGLELAESGERIAMDALPD